MDFKDGHALRKKAHSLIPGGCHTYSKGDDQYPYESPSFIVKGSGCHVWDTDGNEFIEYGMGLRSVTLGHAVEPIVNAAVSQMKLGNNYTRPASIEVEFAEELCGVIPCADMVKFAKDGSTVTTAAVKLARAYTGREDVAFCQDHPFFSYNDWFIGTTPLVGGIPTDGAAHSFAFKYNDIESLKSLFRQYPGRIACVIMEPEREDPPEESFLHRVRDLCTQHGSVLIFDEMITGFRWEIGGAQQVHKVTPDLATFGKALANGFALSALVGKRDIMELGGIYHDKDRVFLLSTTHGAENHAIAAARATLAFYQAHNVVDRLHEQGQKLLDGATDAAKRTGMSDYFRVFGRPCNLAYQTLDDNGTPSQAHRTLFLQELIRNGVIAPSFVVSFSHSDDDIAMTVGAIESALLTLKKAQGKDLQDFIVGDTIKSVYRRKN